MFRARSIEVVQASIERHVREHHELRREMERTGFTPEQTRARVFELERLSDVVRSLLAERDDLEGVGSAAR